MTKHTNREAWLIAAVDALSPLFAAREIELPKVRVSVGFPGGRAKKSTTVGQCWNSHASSDGVPQVFIHPTLIDPQEILGVLTHELIHAVDDCESGHKGAFVKMFRAMGMVGKPTASGVGDELAEELAPVIELLGDYPHAQLGSLDGGAEGPKKQGTRMLKVMCPETGYIVRTTKKWLEEVGLPICPCHNEQMELEEAA